MATNRSGSMRAKFGSALMLVGLLSGVLAVLAPSADAVAVSTDPNGAATGFEIDGNQKADVAGPAVVDWEDLVAPPMIVITDDTLDSGLQGSSKENDPSGWTCDTGGASPPDANILAAAIHVRPTATGPFLDLAFVRAQGNGSSHVNFEFNQNAITNPCPFTGRATGDLLLSFDFPGGSESAVVEVFRWNSAISADGEWVQDNGFPASAAKAASNGADKGSNNIADFIFGMTTIETRKFGEASIDISAVVGQGAGCVSFGEVNIRSRSSGSSLSSALQDRLPSTPVDLSTCGSIVVHKVDDAAGQNGPNPLPGATFGLWKSNVAVPGVVGGTRPDTGSIATCTTTLAGTCTFSDVDPGTYKVAELTPPTGYAIDPTVADVTVAPYQTVDVAKAFVDPRLTGSVQVTKAVSGGPYAVADLKDLRFILEQGGNPVSTWPGGAPAECTLDGISASCDIGPVPLGDYVVTEDPSTLPPLVGQGPDVPVTISTNGQLVPVTLTNPLQPTNISLKKTGPATANVGDTIDYQFDVSTTGADLTDVVLEEIADGADFADRCDATPLTGPDKSTAVDPDNNADDTLEAGETWRWTCQHLVTLDDATIGDGTALQNKAMVKAKDATGAEVSDDDTHTVTVLLPDLSVTKTPDGQTIAAGDPATWTIVVANAGPGQANALTLTDELPDGIDWTVGGADAASCTITPDPATVDQTLACSFGNVAANGSRSITVTGPTDNNSCGLLDNLAVVASTNGGAARDTGDLTIVGCQPPPPPPPPGPQVLPTVVLPIGITLVKDGPDVAYRGEKITYTFVATNSGGVPLVNVTLNDVKCDDGTLELLEMIPAQSNTPTTTVPPTTVPPTTVPPPNEEFQATDVLVGTATMGVGDVWKFDCTRVIRTDDPNPLPNTARVTGTEAGSFSGSSLQAASVRSSSVQSAAVARTVFAEDSHQVRLIGPGIQVVKTVDLPSANVGQTVTFTYVVTNTGDTTLFNIEVVDDQLGAIGTVAQLDPGASATFTKTMLVTADSPTRNVATVTAQDPLGNPVSDDDDATISIVLGNVIEPTEPAPLPRTGAETRLLLVLSGALFLLGGLLVASDGGLATIQISRRRQR